MDVKTFDVLAAAKGRSYPTDNVTVYTDVAALYTYAHLEASANNAKEGDEANEFDEALKPIREQILASGLTFHMRGFAPGVRKSIDEEAKAKFGEDADLDNGDGLAWRFGKYVAESVVKVENVNGDVDEHHWNVDEVLELRAFLAEEEYAKLVDLALQLSLAVWEFDKAVTPDFS